MVTSYPACFYKEKNGGYTVLFPDLNHLVTSGENLEEATKMSIDCLAGYIHWLKKDGDEIPVPTKISEIDSLKIAEKEEYENITESFATLICVDVEEYAKSHFNKAVKRSVTVPDWLDIKAKEAKLNYSKILQNALAKTLGVSLN
jgi:predicted RNase H-like HicB family nuclease